MMSDISFNSAYTVCPANTLTEYFNEMDSSPEMSFRERMQYDMFRTSTFSEFPRNSPVSPLMLAKAGFYYEGKGDEVVCFKCGKRYRNWQKLDVPLQIHRAISPSCPFVFEFGSNCFENTHQLTDGNQGSILYEREHENNHNVNVVNNSNSNSSEKGRNFQRSSNTVERTQSMNQKDAGSVPFQIVCQSMNATNSSLDSHLSVTSGALDSGPGTSNTSSETTRTRNEHENISAQSREPLGTSSENLSGSTKKSQRRTHQERSHINPIQQCSNSINEDTSVFDNSNNPENSSLEPLNHQDSSTVSAPVNNDRPRSAASTLEPLGISIEKPKYPQYAVLATRIASFRYWPDHLHQKPEDLAKSGFLYEGTNDFTRCFFCGGGLRDWEPQDDPWIEHARWYKKCVFVRQCRGEDFVNFVQQGKIQEAMDQLNGKKPNLDEEQRQIEEILTSSAVQSVHEMGYSQENVRLAVQILRRNSAQITADSLLQYVLEIEEGGSHSRTPSQEGTKRQDNKSNNDSNSLETVLEKKTKDETETETLLAENRHLKEQQICKICMDEDISIVFLPCGHMATCVNCAPAVRKCPLCRRFIKGTVKAIMS